MYNIDQVKAIHFEITTKCQARCPMCPRRVNGGILNPLITLTEVSLEQFKSWFSVPFVKQLNFLNMCGNLGDPIIAGDTLEIYDYLRTNNPNITLAMHTNGSARTVAWWRELARLGVNVTFGIDGLADTHHLYRIDTDWYKIIENAQAYIEAGGDAEWEMLVFQHNEHQVDACHQLSQQLKFNKFTVKHTSRFVDGKFHVLDDSGRTTHVLYPTSKSQSMINKVKNSVLEIKPIINCKVKNDLQMYVSANGTISPCCWLDFSWVLPKQDTRIDYMDNIGKFPNLNKQSLEEIFESKYFDDVASTWDTDPLTECSRQCGSFDKLGEQFVS